MTGLKLIEAGLPSERVALIAIPLVPVQIILPWVIRSGREGRGGRRGGGVGREGGCVSKEVRLICSLIGLTINLALTLINTRCTYVCMSCITSYIQ